MPILTAEERIGTLVGGKYRLDNILGAGGMGVVYAATHTWTDRPVAVKLLHHESSRDASVAQRFLQEARSATNVRHPNVVDVLDMGQAADDGSVYLVLEMLDGESLSARLERGVLTVAEALALLLPIMDALEAAHAKGVVHRDMKPDNIFLSHNGAGRIVPKVLDFGIAKRNDSSALGVKTATGQLLGTPYYMSPEQARGAADLGPQSDVWSMGVVWFQCLAGTLPFDDDSIGGLIIKLVTTPAPPLSVAAPGVPAGIASAIDRSLRAERGERHASMAEFAEQLRAAAREADIVAPELIAVRSPDTTGSRPRAPSLPPDALATTEHPAGAVSPVETMSAVARNAIDTGANPRVDGRSPRRIAPWMYATAIVVVGGAVTVTLAQRASGQRNAAPSTVATHTGDAPPPPPVQPLAPTTHLDPSTPVVPAPAAANPAPATATPPTAAPSIETAPTPSPNPTVAAGASPPAPSAEVHASGSTHGHPQHPHADATSNAAATPATPPRAPAGASAPSEGSGNRPGQIRNEW